MAKNILGIDVGEKNLKLALVSGKKVLRTVAVPMPDNMLKEGRVVSGETMGQFIRDTVKKNDLRVKDAAYVMSNETVFVKNVTVPVMTPKQLAYNLPFEFKDYITGEPSEYIFDYATVSGVEHAKTKSKRKLFGRKKKTEQPEGAEDAAAASAAPGTSAAPATSAAAPNDGAASGEEETMDTVELLTVGAARVSIDNLRTMLHLAGLKLHRAAPSLCAYIGILRLSKEYSDPERETCILDLGSHAIRMYIFKGDRYTVTREIETGLSVLNTAVADVFNVDEHLASTYLLSDFEGCQRHDACMNIYINIGVDLMRAMNFYRFSNPDSRLNDVILCGGGSMIAPLREEINQTLGMNVHALSEIVSGDDIEDLGMFAQAIGITQE